jgi:hypothetical protein
MESTPDQISNGGNKMATHNQTGIQMASETLSRFKWFDHLKIEL